MSLNESLFKYFCYKVESGELSFARFVELFEEGHNKYYTLYLKTAFSSSVKVYENVWITATEYTLKVPDSDDETVLTFTHSFLSKRKDLYGFPEGLDSQDFLLSSNSFGIEWIAV